MDASFFIARKSLVVCIKIILGLHQKSFGDSIGFVNKKERALIA